MADNQYVAVRLKDVGGTVAKQGGQAGGLAFALAPTTITSKVYDTIKNEMATKFKEKGVDADVSVMTTPGVPRSIFQPDLLTGAVLGAGLLWLGTFLYKRAKR